MTTRNSGPHDPSADTPAARVVCDTASLAELDPAPAGALWRLSEPGRQLDANVVHIPPARRVDTHCEPDLDVLLLVVAGDGTLLSAEGPRALRQGSLAWLPHGSTRGLVAGELGLSYLTVHTRRPGMRIRPSGAGS